MTERDPLRFEIGYQPDNRRLLRQIDRSRYLQLLRHVAVGVLLLAAVVAAAWPNLEAARLGYRVEELRLEKEELEKTIRLRRATLAGLTEPARIERIAREEFGLSEPEEVARLVLAPAGRNPGPASR